jgi:hypothetical protein
MKLYKIGFSLFLLFCSYYSFSQNNFIKNIQPLFGTNEITFKELSSNGSFLGCELGYKSLVRDFVYTNGDPYVVNGSITLVFNNNQNILTGLKIVTNKMIMNGEEISFLPEPPTFGFLKNNKLNSSKSLINQTTSDTPGGWFGVFELDTNFLNILDAMTKTNKVSIMFNRRNEGLDIEVPLDLTVAETKGDGKRVFSTIAIDTFRKCSIFMVEDWVKRNRKN